VPLAVQTSVWTGTLPVGTPFVVKEIQENASYSVVGKDDLVGLSAGRRAVLETFVPGDSTKLGRIVMQIWLALSQDNKFKPVTDQMTVIALSASGL
jgi:hypothetical protein